MSESAESPAEFEYGSIMVLTGLNKVELNGHYVEIIEKLNDTGRWKCKFLKSNLPDSAIKTENIVPPPNPTPEALEKCDQICNESINLLSEARNSQNSAVRKKTIKIILEKLNEVLDMIPHCGTAHNVLGNVTHFRQKPQHEILKHMRRAVANKVILSTAAHEEKRILNARISLSGTMGLLGDSEGERHHLLLALANPLSSTIPKMRPMLTALLAGTYFEMKDYDKAVEILLKLQQDHGYKKFGTYESVNIDEKIHMFLIKSSCKWYHDGMRLEQQGDSKPRGSDDQKRLYQEAYDVFHKAIRAAPEDQASQCAWLRIQAKRHPNVQVRTEGGLTYMMNMGEGTVLYGSAIPEGYVEEEEKMDLEEEGSMDEDEKMEETS